MKILTADQMRELDAATIENEPIPSIDLMERAASALATAFTAHWGKEHPVKVFAGPGNNGGDALALARILTCRGYQVETYLFNTGHKLSEDCKANSERLAGTPNAHLTEIVSKFDPPKISADDILVDGLFGIGLNKPLEGGYAALVKYINASPATVVAIDIPSGLKCNGDIYPSHDAIIHADYTFTFQLPKPAFFLADCHEYIGQWRQLDIGLSAEKLSAIDTAMTLVSKSDIVKLLKPRSPFGHKGTFGHALLVAGSYGMAGAAILSAKACLRSGVGKVTVHSPSGNNDILQVCVPEAIMSHDDNLEEFSQPIPTKGFEAIGIGPGIGLTHTTEKALLKQLAFTHLPTVIDADAITLLGRHRDQLERLPENTILTPHPKELNALTNNCLNSYSTLSSARELAQRFRIFVVLKGHYTAICTPSGHTYYNPTGNAGMATAGSGDVLTGILTALLARGYSAEAACLIGVYVHGLAGDIAAMETGEESLVASDIIHKLPAAFRMLYPDIKPLPNLQNV